MLKINLITGLAWTKPIITNGNINSDIIRCLDEHLEKYGEDGFPVALYEDITDEEMEEMMPLNGGQYWIYGISSIEEIDEMTAVIESSRIVYNSTRNELYIFNRYNDNLMLTINENIGYYVKNIDNEVLREIDHKQVINDNFDYLIEELF